MPIFPHEEYRAYINGLNTNTVLPFSIVASDRDMGQLRQLNWNMSRLDHAVEAREPLKLLNCRHFLNGNV
jgi:hypothetical protein